jgi:hypothetical protein
LAAATDNGTHALPDLDVRDAVAPRVHVTGYFHARGVGGPTRRSGVEPSPLEKICRVQSSGLDGDDDFTG